MPGIGVPDAPRASEADEQRRAKNETFFRATNELVEREAALRAQRVFDCICECSARGCIDRVDISLAEYERVRAHGDRFVVAPGHQDLAIETVIERHDAYLIVEKQGLARRIAEAADPR
jgi:hypothetical protein